MAAAEAASVAEEVEADVEEAEAAVAEAEAGRTHQLPFMAMGIA